MEGEGGGRERRTCFADDDGDDGHDQGNESDKEPDEEETTK